MEDTTPLKDMLERVGERVKKYHDVMFSIAFREVLQQQELRSNATAKGKPRELIYESVVVARSSAANQKESFPLVTRTLKSVNGKAVKEQSLPQRSKCVDTNPQAAYSDQLTFLLPQNQTKFIFSYAGEDELQGRKAAVVLVATPPASDPVKILTKGNCFSLSRGLQRKGKVWIDLDTFDVLQLQWALAESFSGKMPSGVAKVGIFPVFRPSKKLGYEKSDFMMRFRPVTFRNPEQTLLLPIFSESTWILKGAGIAGFRTTTDYTGYRRFLTTVEIKDPTDDKN